MHKKYIMQRKIVHLLWISDYPNGVSVFMSLGFTIQDPS